jgi:steroid delta-isomerase-like uncharacterized protein
MSNVEKHRSAHQAFNQRNWKEAVKDFRSDTSYTEHPRGQTVKGPAEFVDWMQGWTAAFSDAQVSSPRYIDGGNHTVALFQGTGTNDGQFGPYPPTGKRMDLAYCEVLHYDSDGAIESGEIFYDSLTLLVQLGHAQPPPA